MSHRDEVGREGGWFFTIEIEKDWLAECSPIDPRQMDAVLVEGPPLALRLYFSYRNRTITPLEVESLVLELLGAASGQDISSEVRTPRWLRRTVDSLHDDPAFPHTVRSLASTAGVHPVHLARVFRNRYGSSINHYVQGLRLRMALQAMENPESRIADVACDTGFADQSHLSRVLKHWTGVPPATLRRILHKSSLHGS